MTLKLVVLVVIFVTLPIVLYGQFESADRRTREIVARSIQHRSWLIAQALKPILDETDRPPHKRLNEELAKYSDDGTILKLMLEPQAAGVSKNFYYVASAPPMEQGQVDTELDGLAKNGVLSRLAESCTWDAPIDIRYKQPSGQEEILTSVIPIQSRWGCWVLVSAHVASEYLNTSIGRPFWQTREVRFAAVIYLAMALLTALIALSVWRHVRRFREVAREIRQGRIGRYSFSTRNAVPELASVATDFDHLVFDLHNVARNIRQAAEDNAHSFKSPLATIRSSLEPLKQLMPSGVPRAQRALALIESSLNRLTALVSAAQRLDFNAADLIEAPRTRINLTQAVADILLGYRDLMTSREIRLTRRLDEDVMIHAGQGVIDVVVENILDNAISFSPPGGSIIVTLLRSPAGVELKIEDEGPGIDPKKIDRIFERYFSLRPYAPAAESLSLSEDCTEANHAGLGLWIVQHNIEALGGRVAAANRIGGGLGVRITLPASDP